MIKYDYIAEDEKSPEVNIKGRSPPGESDSENNIQPVARKKITFNFGRIEEEVKTDKLSNMSHSLNKSRKSENHEEYIANQEDNNFLNDSADSSHDTSFRQEKQVIRDEDEKILGKFLKISHLIGENKIKHKEEKKKNPGINLNMGPQVVESDDDDNLEKIVKEIDKNPIPENSYYFIDGDQIKYRAHVKSKKRKKNKLAGLQDLKIGNNTREILIQGQDDEDLSEDDIPGCVMEDNSNVNAHMDLDDIYTRMKQ
jgi:hypothetical protein